MCCLSVYHEWWLASVPRHLIQHTHVHNWKLKTIRNVKRYSSMQSETMQNAKYSSQMGMAKRTKTSWTVWIRHGSTYFNFQSPQIEKIGCLSLHELGSSGCWKERELVRKRIVMEQLLATFWRLAKTFNYATLKLSLGKPSRRRWVWEDMKIRFLLLNTLLTICCVRFSSLCLLCLKRLSTCKIIETF